MRDRTLQSYLTVTREIMKKWEGLLNMDRIHVDYETAEIQALSTVFGEKKVYGCLVHYIRAVMAHLRSKCPNVFKQQNIEREDNGPLRKWVRRITALPILRKSEIGRIWSYMKQFHNEHEGIIKEELEHFVAYIEKQWLTKNEPTNIWNFNKLSRTRSTNPAEAWHSLIKREPTSMRHASVINFLYFFQSIMSDSDDRIIKMNMGKIQARGRDKFYAKLDDQIAETVDEYEAIIETKFHSDEDFRQVSNHYLSRISFLLLEMNLKGTATKKEEKIRERKRKFACSACSSIEEVSTENALIESRATEVSIKPESPDIIISDEPTQESYESKLIFFNPPTVEEQQEICIKWELRFVHPTYYFGIQRQFFDLETGPGRLINVEADGNCFYNSLSVLLTGSELKENARVIRRIITEYIESEVELHDMGIPWHGWWEMFHPGQTLYDSSGNEIISIRTYVHNHIEPASAASEIHKWGSNVDFLAAAKLFKINVIVCSPNPQRKQDFGIRYVWSVYTPDMLDTMLVDQAREFKSIFIYFEGGHFQAITDPKELKPID